MVDLTTRRVLDLLPDREEKSLITLLRKQPKFEIITMDRYSKYRRAATKGSPGDTGDRSLAFAKKPRRGARQYVDP